MRCLIEPGKDISEIMDLELSLVVWMAAGRGKDRKRMKYLLSQNKESRFEGHLSGAISVGVVITNGGHIEKK